jgi:hypothetical protein
VIAALLIAAAVSVLAVASDRGEEAPPADEATEPVTALGAADHAPAPWRAAPVPRAAVPAPYAEAWERAANRSGCALLFPVDGGPELTNARPTAQRTPDDKGWDIFLTGEAGSVEVLALFDKATQTSKQPSTPSFTRTWSDGSLAKYSPDVGNAAPGTYDVSASPYEAVLIVPDQSCAYRIYDTLGRAHLESVFDRLRFMGP